MRVELRNGLVDAPLYLIEEFLEVVGPEGGLESNHFINDAA